ncbi:hypothetical protein KKG72_01990 [bacterium]|nr:hypothetical protein [bacterium]MBU1993249.1 hypothetical protein [bacterium]
MSGGFDKLKDIGAQKIHEKTHIAKQHVQAILHESFDGMSRVQFLGFISILERDYSIELDDLRAKGLNSLQSSSILAQSHSVFITPKEKKNNKMRYLLTALFVFVIAVSITMMNDSSQMEDEIQHIDNTTIENTMSTIEPIENINQEMQDMNASLEDNSSAVDVNETVAAVAEKVIVKSLKILPTVSLWMGYIDLATHEKYQKLFSDELVLDTDKNWLLYLGHGNIKIEVDGEIAEYQENKNLRFLYKDGILKKIDTEEFMSLNKGRKW